MHVDQNYTWIKTLFGPKCHLDHNATKTVPCIWIILGREVILNIVVKYTLLWPKISQNLVLNTYN